MPAVTTHKLYIDGEWTDSSGTELLEVINPATEEVIATVPQATPADIHRAVAAARKAFDTGPVAPDDAGRARRCTGQDGDRVRPSPRRIGRAEHRRGRLHSGAGRVPADRDAHRAPQRSRHPGDAAVRLRVAP